MSQGDVFGIVGTVQASQFRVDRVVAEGGFSVIYRAFHETFRADVALKCLKVPAFMTTELQAEFLEQFRAEGELLFRLSAKLPAVVRPLHVDALITNDGTFVPFMALEWLEGETLGDAIVARAERGEPPMSLDQVMRHLTPVARALAKAHHFPGPNGPMAIVHRDLKPDNIFLCKQSGAADVKILDFGIAKARSAATAIAGRMSQGQTGIVAFSPDFAAPEQWVPKRYGQTGPWTDVYGLALTLVSALRGGPVVEGDVPEMMAVTLDPARRPTPRAFGIEVGEAVERVLQKALALDPRDRHPDAGAFWDALEEATTAPKQARKPLPSENARPPVAPIGNDFHLALAASPFDRRPSESRRLPHIPPPLDWSALAGPIALVVLGLLIAFAVHTHAASTGRVLGIGPLRLSWIGSLLAGFGLFRGAWIVVRTRMG